MGQGFVTPVARLRRASDGCSPSSRPGGEAALRGRAAQAGVRSGGGTVYHQGYPREDQRHGGLIFYFLTLDKFSHSTISHFSEPSLRIVWSCQHSLTVTRRLLASTLRYENTKRKIEEKEKINVYGQGSEKDSTSCVICMTDFKPGERVRRLACLHLFHVDCIDHWLTRQR